MSFPNIRRRLELELSNRSSSASRSPPQDLEVVQFRSPKVEKELKTPERSSLRHCPEAQSRPLDFILTEQSILTSGSLKKLQITIRKWGTHARTDDARTDAQTKTIFLVNGFKNPALRAGHNTKHSFESSW